MATQLLLPGETVPSAPTSDLSVEGSGLAMKHFRLTAGSNRRPGSLLAIPVLRGGGGLVLSVET
jgi:hypothetical protein